MFFVSLCALELVLCVSEWKTPTCCMQNIKQLYGRRLNLSLEFTSFLIILLLGWPAVFLITFLLGCPSVFMVTLISYFPETST